MVRRKSPRGPVPKEAIDFLESKGLRPAFSFLDVWREEHDSAFTVAKIMEKDILTDVQDSLTNALKQGVPYRQWSDEIRNTLDKSGWSAYGMGRTVPHRLRVIYDTNMRAARAVGQWDRIERTKRLRPFLRYALGPSIKHRRIHEGWDGTTLPVDHPFWNDHAPQNGYLCKCHLIQESRVVVQRRGGPNVRAPSSREVPFRNPKTGKIERIPRGIEPGFNHNPGKMRNQVLKQAERESTTRQKSSNDAMKKANK